MQDWATCCQYYLGLGTMWTLPGGGDTFALLLTSTSPMQKLIGFCYRSLSWTDQGPQRPED